MLGVRSQESGVRSQESGVRSQESGVRVIFLGLGLLEPIDRKLLDNLRSLLLRYILKKSLMRSSRFSLFFLISIRS